ncbi:MAG TPA: DinB family protein [Vicinamibacteria bacterium]|nr:DinB family protein [Vicinamibacteria bacterium]
MTDRDFYLARLKAEFPGFMKVLQALPPDKMDYKPHERSPSAAQVVWTLASEQKACCDLVETGAVEWKLTPAPGYDEMLEAFERNWKKLEEDVARMDEAGWTRVGRFSSGGKEFPGQPVGQFLWFILFDAIHHRGQLTTYIRPMGGKVPGVYGPSGDSRS